jgi:hypothetical protein
MQRRLHNLYALLSNPVNDNSRKIPNAMSATVPHEDPNGPHTWPLLIPKREWCSISHSNNNNNNSNSNSNKKRKTHDEKQTMPIMMRATPVQTPVSPNTNGTPMRRLSQV